MILPREFYEKDTITVAKSLLGHVVVRRENGTETSGAIVETEAYMGRIDAAAHSYKGKSERTAIMFGDKGFAYIYMIYGMYYCMNVTSGTKHEPEAILIRALEPLSGTQTMKERRKTQKTENLCSGPGKLCMAMDINKRHYGIDLTKSKDFFIEYGQDIQDIEESRRINIDYAGEAKDYLWRFTIKDNPFVSK